jgi:hypothetical protein
LISDLFLNRATRLAAFPASSVPLLPAFSPQAFAVLLADAEVAEPVSPVRAAGFAAALPAGSAPDDSVLGDCLAAAQSDDYSAAAFQQDDLPPDEWSAVAVVAPASADLPAADSPYAHYSYARFPAVPPEPAE